MPTCSGQCRQEEKDIVSRNLHTLAKGQMGYKPLRWLCCHFITSPMPWVNRSSASVICGTDGPIVWLTYVTITSKTL
jgi:hypothetical protein